jgi:hypothetical protein
MMSDFPSHIILPDKAYRLSISKANGKRAFDRMLVDFRIEGQNPMNNSDAWVTLLGVSRELFDDYPSFKSPVPLEWVLIRFLSHYVRTNSVHIISGPGGEVLKSTTFKDYLGRDATEKEVEQILRMILGSWVRTLPEEPVTLSVIYGSSDFSLDMLKKGINFFKHSEHIKETGESVYKISPSIFNKVALRHDFVSLDRKK